MASWSSQATLALSHQECERADVNKFGGAPPLRFAKPVLEAGPEDADTKQHQVKIKVNDNHVYYNLFVNGTSELALNHVITYNDLIKSLGLDEEMLPLCALLVAKKEAYAKIQKSKEKDPRKKITDREKEIELEIQTILEELLAIQKKRFSLFKQLLHETIRKDWEKLVLDQCFNPLGHVAKGGKRVAPAKPRGLSKSSMTACIRAWLRLNMPSDSAERVRRYIQTHVKKSDRISVIQFGARMQELNEFLPYLPCHKDEENSPSTMVRADKKLGEMDLCNAIIGCMPPDLALAYWAAKGGNHFPVCVQTLIEDLIPKEAMVNAQKAKLEKFKSNAGKPNARDPRNNLPGSTTPMGRVPRKPASGTTKNSSNEKERRLCQKCALWAPAVKNTHNTSGCNKWNQDGTPMKKSSANKPPFKSGKGPSIRNAYAQQNEVQMKECFAQMRKDNKRMFKKELRKRSKKSKKYDSSSSDSDDSN